MRIETIFGAVAVLTLIALAAFALTSGKGGVHAATPQADGPVLALGADVCGCYDRAYESARANPDPMRPLYEGGYSACRESAGPAGGNAWSAGWSAATEGQRRACRARAF